MNVPKKNGKRLIGLSVSGPRYKKSGCGGRIRTDDPWVMKLTGYLSAMLEKQVISLLSHTASFPKYSSWGSFSFTGSVMA